MSMYLPNRLELSLRIVFALPKAVKVNLFLFYNQNTEIARQTWLDVTKVAVCVLHHNLQNNKQLTLKNDCHSMMRTELTTVRTDLMCLMTKLVSSNLQFRPILTVIT